MHARSSAPALPAWEVAASDPELLISLPTNQSGRTCAHWHCIFRQQWEALHAQTDALLPPGPNLQQELDWNDDMVPADIAFVVDGKHLPAVHKGQLTAGCRPYCARGGKLSEDCDASKALRRLALQLPASEVTGLSVRGVQCYSEQGSGIVLQLNIHIASNQHIRLAPPAAGAGATSAVAPSSLAMRLSRRSNSNGSNDSNISDSGSMDLPWSPEARPAVSSAGHLGKQALSSMCTGHNSFMNSGQQPAVLLPRQLPHPKGSVAGAFEAAFVAKLAATRALSKPEAAEEDSHDRDGRAPTGNRRLLQPAAAAFVPSSGLASAAAGAVSYRAVSFKAAGPDTAQQDREQPAAGLGMQQQAKQGQQGDTPVSPKPRFAAFEAHTTGIGSRLLQRMGWQEGQGLGLRKDGMATPIQPVPRPPKLGLGAKPCRPPTTPVRQAKPAPSQDGQQDQQGLEVTQDAPGYPPRPALSPALALSVQHFWQQQHSQHQYLQDEQQGQQGQQGLEVTKDPPGHLPRPALSPALALSVQHFWQRQHLQHQHAQQQYLQRQYLRQQHAQRQYVQQHNVQQEDLQWQGQHWPQQQPWPQQQWQEHSWQPPLQQQQWQDNEEEKEEEDVEEQQQEVHHMTSPLGCTPASPSLISINKYYAPPVTSSYSALPQDVAVPYPAGLNPSNCAIVTAAMPFNGTAASATASPFGLAAALAHQLPAHSHAQVMAPPTGSADAMADIKATADQLQQAVTHLEGAKAHLRSRVDQLEAGKVGLLLKVQHLEMLNGRLAAAKESAEAAAADQRLLHEAVMAAKDKQLAGLETSLQHAQDANRQLADRVQALEADIKDRLEDGSKCKAPRSYAQAAAGDSRQQDQAAATDEVARLQQDVASLALRN